MASVVVASRHRPVELALCLRALDLQDHPSMEIVVVADPAGLESAAATGIRHHAVAYDTANLSAARNLGINAAQGEFILFIDDDAVAEPTWVGRLLQALDDSAVVAATGPVLGTNGIALQWGLTYVDSLGLDQAEAGPDRVIKLLGTNMGFRAETLREVGGFDPALRFYLDDADISRRIAAKGRIAFAADAVVQHGFAPSAQRRVDRVPVTLHDIGRSSAIFLRRHGHDAEHATLRARLWADQSARIARHVAGQRITSAAGLALMAGLETGWQEGLALPLSDLPELKTVGHRPMRRQETAPGPRKGIVLSGRFWSRPRLEAVAADLAKDGWIVTVICLSPGPRAHRHRFDARGFWIQTGGVLGWSDRRGPRIVWKRFQTRIREEVLRLSRTRPVGD